MKNLILIALAFTMLYACQTTENTYSNIKAQYPEDTQATELTVFELFTSEGCTSCPPVQETLNTFIEQQAKNNAVICLSQHVDYWNNLVWGEGKCRGFWIDEFSSGFYTARQFAYAKKLDTIPATPEIFVNGRYMARNNSIEELDSLASIMKIKNAFTIDLRLNQAVCDANNNLLIDFKTQLDTNYNVVKPFWPSLIVYLVLEHSEKTPDKAENCGNLLVGKNVALSMESATLRKSNHGTLALRIPEGTKLEQCKVMAIVQNLHNLDIIGGTTGFELN